MGYSEFSERDASLFIDRAAQKQAEGFAIAAAAVSGEQYKSYALGFDGSHYVSVDWDVIAPHLDYVIWKASEGEDYRDETFPAACQAAYDHNLPFGAYHFFRVDPYLGLPFPSSGGIIDKYWPAPAQDKQLQNMIGALKNKAINFVAVDVEAIKELATGKIISSSWAAATLKIFIGRVGDYLWKTDGGAHPNMPLVLYTSNGYIATYAPDLVNLDWGMIDQWVAQWSVYPENTVTLSWEQLRASYLPTAASKPKPFGNGSARLWQFAADRLILPGVFTNDGTKRPRTSDLNLFIGSPAAMRAWCSYQDHGSGEPPDTGGGTVDNPDLAKLTQTVVDLTARVAKLEADYGKHTHGGPVTA